MRYYVTLPSGNEHVVDVDDKPGDKLRVTVGGKEVRADVVPRAEEDTSVRAGRGSTSVIVDGKAIELWLESDPPDVGVIASGRRFFARVESERMRSQAAARPASKGEGSVRSPMPGRVVRVLVAEGDVVAQGAPVIVVEAMKMENELTAGCAGKVAKIVTPVGSNVEGGAVLVEIALVETTPDGAA